MLFDICQHKEVQLDSFTEDDNEVLGSRCAKKSAEVITIMNRLNKKFGYNQQSAVFIASEGIRNNQ